MFKAGMLYVGLEVMAMSIVHVGKQIVEKVVAVP